MIRAAQVLLLAFLLPAAASGQAAGPAAEKDKDKPSNDQPGRPLQMPPALPETKEAFDDFERFSRRGAWERATKALDSITDAQAARFVDGKDGFIIPVSSRRRAALMAMPPEGVAAYRLFRDADAKKMLDAADGPTEQATLERLYSGYFLTTVGDNAADRLGDLLFEQGRFDRAANCWMTVLRDRPDTDIPPARLAVKAAWAYARAGRVRDIDAIRRDYGDRLGDEVVAIGGRKLKAAEHLRAALAAAQPAPAAPAPAASASGDDGPAPQLGDAAASAWQVRFADSVTAGMTPLELRQWEQNPASAAVPAVAVDGDALFLNYLGHILRVDRTTGKLAWRSAPFHNLEVSANGGSGMAVDTKGYAILAGSGLVWSLGRDPRESSMPAGTKLACRRAETGEVVWQSGDLPEHAGIGYQGRPILARGTLFLAAKASGGGNNGMNQGADPMQMVVAVRPHDGKILWKAEIGLIRGSNNYEYYGMADTTVPPRLAYRAGSIYIDTHAGILARVDADSGSVDWGYAYATDPVQSQHRFVIFVNGMPQATDGTPAGEPPLFSGDALLVKGAKADRICAIDPDAMTVLWDRPIGKAARLIGIDDTTLYLGGSDLGALDRQSRALRWSLPLPIGTVPGRVLVRPEGVWQLTARGIFEVNPGSGQVRRIFRGDDPAASGGDLLLDGPWLLAVTNRAITAYPRAAAPARAAHEPAADAGPATTTRGSDD